MENVDANDLIERYLNGSLSVEDHQLVEGRLASDAAFRAEVALHRQLHEEFADPRKLQLRHVLSDIVETAPTPAANYGWLKGLALVLLTLLLLWLGWHWYTAAEKPLPATPEQPQMQLPTTPTEVPDSLQQDTPDQSLKKEPLPIAMANPADFALNREFEDRLGSMVRSTDGPVNMFSPAMGADFSPRNNFIKINFHRTVPASDDETRYPLVLKIYTHQGAAQPPKMRILPPITNRDKTAGRWTFSVVSRLQLRPGLYYYTLERQADEELLFIGKFTVGGR